MQMLRRIIFVALAPTALLATVTTTASQGAAVPSNIPSCTTCWGA